MHVIRIPEGEKKGGAENIPEETMDENFPSLPKGVTDKVKKLSEPEI